MQALTADEIAILKSRFQAGASGHRQKVTLTAQFPTAVPQTAFGSPFISLLPSGDPYLVFSAVLPVISGGDGLVHVWGARYFGEHALGAPLRLDTAVVVTNDFAACVAIPGGGVPGVSGVIVVMFNNPATSRWVMRRSLDNGLTWTAQATPTPLAAVISARGCLDLVVDGSSIYAFFIDNDAGNVRYILSTDGGATWGASTDTTQSSAAFVKGLDREFRVFKNVTTGTWHMMTETPAQVVSVARSPLGVGGPWSAFFGLNSGSGGDTRLWSIGGFFANPDGGFHALHAGEHAGGSQWLMSNKSTDDGLTWGARVDHVQVGITPSVRTPMGMYVPKFKKGYAWGADTGSFTIPSVATAAHLSISQVLSGSVLSVLNSAWLFAGAYTTYTPQTVDVSGRVLSIALDKSIQLDSDTFNLELNNEDGALNIATDTAPGALADYAKATNVVVDIYQWYGVVANMVQTFHGISDSHRQHDSPRTILFTGRCGVKKLLVQEVRLIAPQDLKVTGYVRDMSNFVYLNKTLNEVLTHILNYGAIPAASRAFAPSTFVFKELRGNDSETLMDLCRRACDIAGMDFWCDELGTYRTRPIGAAIPASTWTFRSYEDITVLDPDVNDDGLKTRVRVLGKANIGAKYLAEQFKWPGPEAPGSTNGPAAVAYDKTTGHLWVLTQNSNLYRLDPNANMAIVAGPFALGLGYPDGLAVDPLDNNLWVSDGFDATLGNNVNRKYKKINRATQALMLGPFTNPDGDHCAIWAWNNAGTIQLKMTTYTTARIYTMSIAGATVSLVASPVAAPTALASDAGGGLYLSGWDAVDFYQVDFAGNIVNNIAQPDKNGNAITTVEDPASPFDFGSVYEAFRDQNVIVKYVPTVPSGVETATYAEVVNSALEDALLGEVRLARLTDLGITDKAQATKTAQRQLDRISVYSKHNTFGAIGNPAIQKGDRITLAIPGASLNGDWSVTNIRSDQIARDGTYLMVIVAVPYRALTG